MNDKLIQEIYDSAIGIVLQGVDEKYKDELCLSYMEYLKKFYLSSDLDVGNKKPEELIKIFINFEKSKWKVSSVNSKLSELLSDPAFEKIIDISNKGYEYAEEMLHKNFMKEDNSLLEPVIDKKTANKNIEMLNMYYEQVKEFNKQVATYHVSEGSIDFQFASGATEYMSLRIGRMKR